MNLISFKNLYFSSLLYYLLSLQLASIHVVTVYIQNNCNYTVWAASLPGGGKELKHGQGWVVNANGYTRPGRIWARTNCEFDANGIGKCETGDCNGTLHCRISYGKPPYTIVEYGFSQLNGLDYVYISLLHGFNVPLEFRGTSSNCTRVVKCTADINGLCPTELRHSGGCHHPCHVFKNDQFCCNGDSSCNPTAYSKSWKDLCPDVFTYTTDDKTSTFTCPNGNDYKLVFCPN